jgi:putative transposase
MMTITRFLLLTARSLFKTRSALLLENLALRQQLATMRNSVKRPRLRLQGRLFWYDPFPGLERVEAASGSGETGDRNRMAPRKGFKFFWKCKLRRKKPGRPRVSKEVRGLVRRMAEANPSWGAPRFHGELKKLGINVSERTVSNLMPHRTKPPSQTWRTFLKNHMDATYAIDFFTVPTRVDPNPKTASRGF